MPYSTLILFQLYEPEISNTVYSGICPITPLKLLSVALVASVNWLEQNRT